MPNPTARHPAATATMTLTTSGKRAPVLTTPYAATRCAGGHQALATGIKGCTRPNPELRKAAIARKTKALALQAGAYTRSHFGST